ncbi:MAG: 5'/3'-nucleotidase SurE [Candidatus Riflebacteria bacterium]|nr:5'/3'-nucleotidase SurE [Candidatus Riflebacteria bacterium]
MKILLSNDDGISASGIRTIANYLRELGELVVVAPHKERSAMSSALTLHDPLRVQEHDFEMEGVTAYSVSGTPADCVKIALANILKQKPDLIVSGINRGGNMADDVIYSGTVGAALEGAFKNILSVALSLSTGDKSPDFEPAARISVKCIKEILKADLPKHVAYSINVPQIPEENVKGLMVTRTGKLDYGEHYEKRIDPRGNSWFWAAGKPEIVDYTSDLDVVAVRDGYVSITPLLPDMTSLEHLQTLRDLFDDSFKL